MRTKEQLKSAKKLHSIQSNINFNIEVFGDHLAEREGYKEHDGIDAIHFYLIQKYNWTPATVRQFSFDDLELLLKEEMHGWTVPKKLRDI